MSKNSSAKFYQKTKEKKVHQRYPSLSKEEKEKKQESSCGQYKCLPKDEKQKLTQYKKYILQNEKKHDNHKKLFSFRKLFFFLMTT